MALAVPSRFACLKIEDDDYRPKSANKPKPTVPNNPNNKNKKVENNKTNVKTKKGTTPNPNSAKQQPNKTVNKTNKNFTNNTNKKVTQNTNKPNQNQNANTNKSSQKKKKEVDQWEKWKEKDMQLVDGKFEDDLQNAILLSKLDYEEKKEFYQQNKKEAELAEKNKENKKNKKKKAMSLEQFNNMCDGKKGKAEELKLANGIKAEFDDSFFERINCEAREEIQREQTKQIRKAREPYNDAVTIAQFQAELEKLRAENLVLRQELESARTDIVNVKTRNKKLCSLLGQGEMREKAEILLEVERLQRVQAELTSEVTRLHAELEQERSKSAAFTHDSKHKEKNKKRSNNEGTHQQSK